MSDWVPDITALQAFDDTAWLKVERAYCGRLLAYVARRVPDTQAREDVLQETFLGAVRGIGAFDPAFTFEQYLFGICKNRTIDHLRRKRMATFQAPEDSDEPALIERLAHVEETPSQIVRKRVLARDGQELLRAILRDWVQEAWQEREYTRLMVIEALFAGNWRNKDTWERFDLRDETSVAGIKFRALKRLRELARERDSTQHLIPELADGLSEDPKQVFFDVAEAWRAGRVSCPARHWLARLEGSSLEPEAEAYVRFHLDEMKCEWCLANHDDLARADATSGLEPLLDRVGASTLQVLRSRTKP